MTLPLLQPSPTETLAERCRRMAAQIEDYEADTTNRAILDLTAIRVTLEQSAEALS